MITSTFRVLNKDRLIELQQCIKHHAPSTRFVSTYECCDGSIDVVITYGSNKIETTALDALRMAWYTLDNPPESEKLSLFKRIINCFKLR